ncbi:hypothetical protein ABI59_10120 [Acidobacteria bacterium Mor1]|nr:hypothetical protein ABI59_10120 [Acidobacteria bacterium Mor1]
MRTIVGLMLVLLVHGSVLGMPLEIDPDLPQGGDCPLIGSWDGSRPACVVTDYTIADGEIVRVLGGTLDIVGTLTNHGRLETRGTLLIQGFLNNINDVVTFSDGHTVNRGQYFSHFMYSFGPLTNEPGASIEFEFFVENSATMLNFGHIDIGGTYNNIPWNTFENHGSVTIHPGGRIDSEALLLNTGTLDNQGLLENDDVVIDQCGGSISGNPLVGNPAVPAATLTLSTTTAEWCVVEGAAHYDLVQGSLDLLRSSGGDFAAATDICVVNDTTDTSAPLGAPQAPGSGQWFLLRSNGIGTPTFDSMAASQAAPRDPGIIASGLACP